MIVSRLDKAQAMRYMGMRGELSDTAKENIGKLMDKCEELLLKLIEPKYTYRSFELTRESEGIRLSGSSLVLTGNDIAELLCGCDTAVLICATLGIGADRLIRQLSLSDIAEGFAADALASAAIEQVCDAVENEIKKRFEGKGMTWRFSPGYGDLPIELQREFLDVTDAQRRLGVTLSDGGMLIPSKSVTAVIGISEEIKDNDKKGGCEVCNMADRCSFRKRGESCGV